MSWRRILLFILETRGKRFRVQLPRQIFDGRNDSRRRPVDGFTDHRKTAIAYRVKTAPARSCSQNVEIVLRAFRVGLGEDKKIRLQTDDFFKTHLRPILRRVDDGGGAGEAQGVGDEGGLADRDERVGPNYKKDTARRQAVQPLLKLSEMVLKVSAESRASFRGTENVGETFGRRDDFLNGVGISGVRRNAKIFESVHGFQSIQFSDQDQIRLESDNLFEIRIDGATDFRFFLRVRRKIAIIGVADKVILQTERVHRLGKAGRKGDDALDGLRNAHGAAGFIHKLFIGGCSDGSRRCRLGAKHRASKDGAEKRSRNQTGGKKGNLEIFRFRHKSPIQLRAT